jgi:hypothetical protein
MIDKFANDLANQMGVELSKVLLTDGSLLGCRDAYILDMWSNDRIASTIIFEADIGNLKNNTGSARLEVRIRSALSRLQ